MTGKNLATPPAEDYPDHAGFLKSFKFAKDFPLVPFASLSKLKFWFQSCAPLKPQVLC
jgi:hypothetical protein